MDDYWMDRSIGLRRAKHTHTHGTTQSYDEVLQCMLSHGQRSSSRFPIVV